MPLEPKPLFMGIPLNGLGQEWALGVLIEPIHNNINLTLETITQRGLVIFRHIIESSKGPVIVELYTGYTTPFLDSP
jgi:hypothetical protein